MIRPKTAFYQEILQKTFKRGFLVKSTVLVGLITFFFNAPLFGVEPTKIAKAVTEDFKKAKFMAEVYQKPIVLLFVGSDWCPNSQLLLKMVEKEDAFFSVLKHRFIVVKIDFKEIATINKELLETNYSLKNQYGIENFPALVIVDPHGEGFIKIDSIADNGERLAECLIASEKKLKQNSKL